MLVPGWQELIGKPLIEVVAHQWAITTRALLQDLKELSPEQVYAVNYADLVAGPQETMEALTRFLSLDWDVRLDRQLPMSKTTVSRPGRDKWRANEQLINSVLPIIADAHAEARAFVEELRQSSKAAA